VSSKTTKQWHTGKVNTMVLPLWKQLVFILDMGWGEFKRSIDRELDERAASPFLKTNNKNTIMKQLTTVVLLFVLPLFAKAQTIPLEIMAGNTNTFYQHSAGKNFPESERFGWMNIASVLIRYDKGGNDAGKPLPDEIMNQTYIVYRPWKKLALLGGGFYTDVTKFRLSAALQWVYKNTSLAVVLAPRVDVQKNGAYEMFGMVEFKPGMRAKDWSWYSRFQFMTNHGPKGHNRSYEQFRLGAGYKTTHFGLALTLDQYGPDVESLANSGVFIRRVF
jgi:hypothetical protein